MVAVAGVCVGGGGDFLNSRHSSSGNSQEDLTYQFRYVHCLSFVRPVVCLVDSDLSVLLS